MSIVTLQRKSQAMHSQVSKGEFNINGKLRQAPHNIFRTPTYTRMKGPDPVGVGAGSHCRVGGIKARICKRGYPVNVQLTDVIVPQTVANKSTYSNVAMMEMRFRKFSHGSLAIAAPYPSRTVTEYIENKARDVVNCLPLVGEVSKNLTRPCAVTKNTNKYVVPYNSYMLKLTSKCIKQNPIKVWHTNTLIGSVSSPTLEQLEELELYLNVE